MAKDKEARSGRSRDHNGEKDRGSAKKKHERSGGRDKDKGVEDVKSKKAERSSTRKASKSGKEAREPKPAESKRGEAERGSHGKDAKRKEGHGESRRGGSRDVAAEGRPDSRREQQAAEEHSKPKEAKEGKEPKAAKDPKESKEHKEQKESKEAKEAKEPRESKEAKGAAEEAGAEQGRKRPAVIAALSDDDDCAASRSASVSSTSSGTRRKRRREREAARGLSGFSTGLGEPAPQAVVMYGPSTSLVPIGEKVQGLLNNSEKLAFEVARMKQAVEAASLQPKEKAEIRESVLKMPKRLAESLLEPANRVALLARTGLLSAQLNEEGLVVLKAQSRKGLMKALGQLRRVAYHCQWGCSSTKVAMLLAEKPAKAVHTIVVRLAATSSRLESFEARLTHKVRKLRIGTQAGACQLVVEGVPGLSRKHCTITFEPDKGACYVQDLSTNGTYLNGKRLPRPPFRNPQDARVRVFHGDELFFRLRSNDAEELGYVINLLELS